MSTDHISRFHRNAVSVAEARNRILKHVKPGGTEQVSLVQGVDRYIAEDVIADLPMPHFRRSGLDGFAIVSEDTREAASNSPVTLTVIDNIACGSLPTRQVVRGTAARIMTGAYVPEGADAVIMLEMTDERESSGTASITIRRTLKPGDNITEVGDEIHKGEQLLKRGARLDAGAIALLAAYGYSEVEVYRKPRIAIFATGSELLEIGKPIVPGKIRNSNTYMLAAQAAKAGAEVISLGLIADEVTEARNAIARAFMEADMVVTTGGVSVGDYDILAELFASWDGELLFNKVMMRPGSPTSAGRWKDKFLFALSGNPGACFVGFELFVLPAIHGSMRMKFNVDADTGSNFFPAPVITGILKTDFPKINSYTRYIRGRRLVESGVIYVEPVGQDRSSVMITIKDADCLIVIPPTSTGIREGQLVEVIPLQTV